MHELLRSLSGRSVSELAGDLLGERVNLLAKSAHAVVIRRLLEERGLAGSLDERGTTVKVVRRDRDGDPIEKTTFRNFDHESFPREAWQSSELRRETREILFIVFDAEHGQTVEDARLAGGLFWSPNPDQDREIERDWHRAQEAIKYRFDPPKEKDTRAVHVATKGRDSDDVEKGAQGTTYRKECLALNKAFVAEILSAHMPRAMR